MILVIFVSFLVCYLPITIVKVIKGQHPTGQILLFNLDCWRPVTPFLVFIGLHSDLPEHLHKPDHLRPHVHRVQTGLLQFVDLSQL